jgi:Predicted HD superfamily hydrolase
MNMANWTEYLDVVADIINHDDVRAMMHLPHHYDVSCYEHSVFVSYLSFVTAKKLELDYVAAARAGLLHDLYLYDKDEKKQLALQHYTAHPKIALENALKITELSKKERNIIMSHMWPVPCRMPKSREAVIVNLVDKYCASVEGIGIWHRLNMRLIIATAAFA